MPRSSIRFVALAALVAGLALPAPAPAQWTHRYPKLQGMSHHVYLEGYELPLLTIGPVDPAPAPDGRRIAFASRGWLWVMDLDTGAARRVTSGSGIDARPAWSPDGRSLAFVRDDTRETSIVILDLSSGTERVAVAEAGIDMDPAFGPDGRSLLYASAVAGDFDLWRLDLASGRKTRLTQRPGLEMQPVPVPGRDEVVYVSKTGTTNEIRARDLATGDERVLASGPLITMLRIALSPDGRTLAYTWPASDANGWELRLVAIDAPTSTVMLTAGPGQPLTPAWSADGQSVYYAEADTQERMVLHRAAATGGEVETVPVLDWDWAAPMGRVRITTRLAGRDGAAPARLGVVDGNGHPLVADLGQPRFDGQNGVVFFYSPGSIELAAPAGEVRIQAVQGLATPAERARVTVAAGSTARADLVLRPVWRPQEAGWLAGEHHFHLNYGGPYRLTPDDLEPMARAEDMDVLTPLLANLHTRFEDQPLWAWHQLDRRPYLAWGQEVRSHFLGHIGLVGTGELFWPWIWGPGYQVYGRDDRPNAEVLAFAKRQGGFAAYVHPVTGPRPFDDANLAGLPVELVADGALGLFDALEVACLWSDEIGSAEMWYRLLNIGNPVALSAGTDVMNDFYRTMAIGTTRIYVRTDSTLGFRGYLDALEAGRSFVTTGPLLDFRVEGLQPGDVLSRGRREAAWSLDLHTAVPVDSVEIIVDGRTAARFDGLAAGGSRRYQGTLRLPAGGWIAARALGPPTTAWPAMDSYAFAHTGPIWIGERGSVDPSARRAAARDLLRALDAALTRLHQGYGETPIPNLEAQFGRARARLTALARE